MSVSDVKGEFLASNGSAWLLAKTALLLSLSTHALKVK